MIETILSITKKDFSHSGNIFEGFVIKTDLQIIKIGIENRQQCCEESGCLISDDNSSDFIGAEILSISKTDIARNTIRIIDLDLGGAMFININTNKGLFQIAAYNSHNGYYGHDAVIISNQLNKKITL